MSAEREGGTLLTENSEVAFNHVRDRLVEATAIFNGLVNSYDNLSDAANNLNSNVFAHRRQVDATIDRISEVGHFLDKLIKQIDILLVEYQSLSVVDQITLGQQIIEDKYTS